MSTGKRLAKRSIIGTRVAAPGDDGKYYTGSIHALKSPASASSGGGLSITSKTRYVVRFDNVPGGRPPSPNTEYTRRDLIGPGFGLVSSTNLVQGQKVYLTYNGREINAEVIEHRKDVEEIDVLITPSGQEDTMTLTRRIDEIRLLESRKSARLADQDTDFARLADMAGDRKRTSSHSIEMPHVPGSRKRRQSTSSDYERSYSGNGSGGNSSGSGNGNSGYGEVMGIPHRCGRKGCNGFNDKGDCMDECAAALVLMSLSCSPHGPHGIPFYFQQNYGSWGDQGTAAASPGAGGASSSSSSGESWRTETPSPSLSEDGVPANGTIWPTPAQHPSHNQLPYPCIVSSMPYEGTPNGALDEGIVPDYLEDMHPRKKKSRRTRSKRALGENKPPTTRKILYRCKWRGCGKIKSTRNTIEDHVRQVHLRTPRDPKAKIREEEFYYEELTLDHVSSPPTMSHRDMARPPHEDPEYQKLLRLQAAPVTVIRTGNISINAYSNINPSGPNVTVPGGVIRNGSNKMFTFGLSNSPQHVSQQQEQQPQQQQPLQQEEEQSVEQPHHQQQQQVEQPREIQPQQQQQDQLTHQQQLHQQLLIQQQQLLQHKQKQKQKLQQQQQKQQKSKQKNSGLPMKQVKLSPRPLQMCQQNIRLLAVTSGKISTSRKTRSDTKKCRKIYGMINRELWCTQCKWKKACTRFGE